MDFKASQYDNTIPSKSTIVPSQNQLQYEAGQTIKFSIPPFMGFIDPRQSYLKFKVKATCSSPATFSKRCGIQSIINNLRLYDGTMSHQLENIQQYAELVAKKYHYSENDSVKNKRALLELLEPTSRYYDNVGNDNDPSVLFNTSQLSRSYKTGNFNFDSGTSTTDVNDATPQECEVAMKLHSGILGGDRMFPAALVSGLELELDTNPAGKCLELWAGAGIVADDGNVDSSVKGSCRFGIAAPTPTTANPLTSVVLNVDSVNGTAQTATAPAISAAALTAGAKVVRNGAVGASNLVRGQNLYGWSNANPPIWTNMGKITRVEYNGGAGAAAIELTVHLDGTGANGNSFTGGAGGGTAGPSQDKTNTCGVRKSDAIAKCNYTLEDIELVLKTASPPASYVEKLRKQTLTEEGATFDYHSPTTYRNNVPQGESVSQINIPAMNERATAIMVLPMNNNLTEDMSNDNLGTVLDRVKDYQFIVNGRSQPTRRVECGRLSLTPALREQVQLFETEKALASSKVMVRNLNRPEDNFMFSRALARYGGVYNLRADGNISLRTQASSNPQLNKLMVSYVNGLRRLRVGKNGVQVEL